MVRQGAQDSPVRRRERGAQKAKIQLSTLARQLQDPQRRRLFRKSGSRFAVLVPREGVKLTLVLAGIKAPRQGRSLQPGGGWTSPTGSAIRSATCRDRRARHRQGRRVHRRPVRQPPRASPRSSWRRASPRCTALGQRCGQRRQELAVPAQAKAKQARKGMWHRAGTRRRTSRPPTRRMPAPAASADAARRRPGQPEAGARQAARGLPRDIVITHIDPATGRLEIQEVGARGAAAALRDAR